MIRTYGRVAQEARRETTGTRPPTPSPGRSPPASRHQRGTVDAGVLANPDDEPADQELQCHDSPQICAGGSASNADVITTLIAAAEAALRCERWARPRPSRVMSVEEVDQYLAQLDEPKRSTLETLRRTILAIVPGADQGLAYGVPVFLVAGHRISGFSAAKHHVSYLPHSGDVLATFDNDDLAGFSASKGALRMPIDTPLPDDVVRRLIVARCAEAGVSI